LEIPFEYGWRITGTKFQQFTNWRSYEQPKENSEGGGFCPVT
jgi:hypothetical protein